MVRYIEISKLNGVEFYTMEDENGDIDTGFAIEKHMMNHAENLKWAYRSEIEITDKRTGKKLEIESGKFIWK